MAPVSMRLGVLNIFGVIRQLIKCALVSAHHRGLGVWLGLCHEESRVERERILKVDDWWDKRARAGMFSSWRAITLNLKNLLVPWERLVTPVLKRVVLYIVLITLLLQV